MKMGERIKFRDANATGYTFCVGSINGTPITNPSSGDTFVPVWCERDNGREATTVYVNEANIIEQETRP